MRAACRFIAGRSRPAGPLRALLALFLFIVPASAPAQTYEREWQKDVQLWLSNLRDETKKTTIECLAALSDRTITIIGIPEDEPRLDNQTRRELNRMVADVIPGEFTPRLQEAYRQMIEGILPQRAASASQQSLADFYRSDMFLNVEVERRKPGSIRLNLSVAILNPSDSTICTTVAYRSPIDLDLRSLERVSRPADFYGEESFDLGGALKASVVQVMSTLRERNLSVDRPLPYLIRSRVEGSGCRLETEIRDAFREAYADIRGKDNLNRIMGSVVWPPLKPLPTLGEGEPLSEINEPHLIIESLPSDESPAEDAAAVAEFRLTVSAHDGGLELAYQRYKVAVEPRLLQGCGGPEPAVEAACAVDLEAAKAQAIERVSPLPLYEYAYRSRHCPQAAQIEVSRDEVCRSLVSRLSTSVDVDALDQFLKNLPDCPEAAAMTRRRDELVAARLELDRKQKEEQERQRAEAERLRAEEHAKQQAQAEAEQRAREEMERWERQKAQIRAELEAELRAKEEAERKEREEAERREREKAQLRAEIEAERKAQEEADRLEREKAERLAREEAQRKDREDREEARLRSEREAERRAREKAEREEKERLRIAKEAERKAQAERKPDPATPSVSGVFGKWSSVLHRGNWRDLSNVMVCYLYAEPQAMSPPGLDHGRISFALSSVPSAGAGTEATFTAGYDLYPGSEVVVKVDGKPFRMFTEGDSAWLINKGDEPRLLAAMKRGKQMVVSARSRKGSPTAYTYSLAGVTAALSKLESDCH